jgi:hypothetical protein
MIFFGKIFATWQEKKNEGVGFFWKKWAQVATL